MAKATIGIGSNLGDRQANLRLAEEGLALLPGTTVIATSRHYETAPVGPVQQQGMFLNGAVLIETTLSPAELLTGMQAIEARAGRLSREARVHWGPRELDMDILFYDDQIIQSDTLNIPHPQLHKRWFVLRPLADIAPEWVHPVLGKTVSELLEKLEYTCDRRD